MIARPVPAPGVRCQRKDGHGHCMEVTAWTKHDFNPLAGIAALAIAGLGAKRCNGFTA